MDVYKLPTQHLALSFDPSYYCLDRSFSPCAWSLTVKLISVRPIRDELLPP